VFELRTLGTPNLINSLQATEHLFVGTERNTFAPEFAVHFSRNTDFSRISDPLSKAQKGTTAAIAACGSAATRTRSTEQPNDITLSFALVNGDCLGIRVQGDSTGGVPKQFLHYLDVRSGCPLAVMNRCVDGTCANRCAPRCQVSLLLDGSGYAMMDWAQ
jgi:hypothetical protein